MLIVAATLVPLVAALVVGASGGVHTALDLHEPGYRASEGSARGTAGVQRE